jgi:hypothetical protein
LNVSINYNQVQVQFVTLAVFDLCAAP